LPSQSLLPDIHLLNSWDYRKEPLLGLHWAS
jgi:hypothetical protein